MTINTMPKSLMSLGNPVCGHPELSERSAWTTSAFIGAGYGMRSAQGEVSPQVDLAIPAPQAIQGVKSRGPRAWSCRTT